MSKKEMETMMNRKLLIGGGIGSGALLLMLVAGIAFALGGGCNKTPAANQSQTNQDQQANQNPAANVPATIIQTNPAVTSPGAQQQLVALPQYQWASAPIVTQQVAGSYLEAYPGAPRVPPVIAFDPNAPRYNYVTAFYRNPDGSYSVVQQRIEQTGHGPILLQSPDAASGPPASTGTGTPPAATPPATGSPQQPSQTPPTDDDPPPANQPTSTAGSRTT